MGAFLVRKSKTGTGEGNRVQRAVHISLRVTDWRGCQYTEGDWYRSRKQSNDGTEVKIRY